MKAFHIIDRTIMLRDHHGDLFHFALVDDTRRAGVRLAAPPLWKDGSTPPNAAARIDLAKMSALDIARQNGLLAG